MPKRAVSLSDKFDLSEHRQILTGTQAVVRLALMQKARDEAAGLKTAGYISGYRGSPIAGLESAFQRVSSLTAKHDIHFHPGLNEDLAATAIWGSQQAELRGDGAKDGVFAIWYGKGPGVDRTGDVFRHANHAGTSKHGGVLAMLGDDHTCESSTSAHQSEFAMVDAMIPVFNPAGVQEILDYGLYGWAMSRYAGVWVGIKCVKDNIESTATVDGRPDRVQITYPTDFVVPPGGLNIRVNDSALAKEARLHDYKRGAAIAFTRANKLDRIVIAGGSAPKIGIVSCGKSYLDVRQALDELGLDEVEASRLGVRLLKVAVVYPLEPEIISTFAKGLDLIIVVEEKRSLLEVQIKEYLFDTEFRPRVIGKQDEHGASLFQAKGALEPTDIAIAIGERVLRVTSSDAVAAKVGELRRLKGNTTEKTDIFTRIPYFCSGCPHNSSTVVPEGSRAYAGIGCHYMSQWMDRSTEGFTQMGGEGTNWIGEAPFSTRKHVFQNLGDGTYIHSGSLAIRAALATDVNMTFKVLYNDAVAMTGGQKLDGGLTVGQIAHQLLAEGIKRLALVTDEPDKYGIEAKLPKRAPKWVSALGLGHSLGLDYEFTIHHRRDLQAVQLELAKTPGVSALIFDQTCAAEKRRRRKKGEFPDPDRRVYINPSVCEGCGDCGVKSNCVSVTPLETPLGRKRKIDQSSCNKDFSCVEGFCPSFVTVHGAKPRKVKASADTGSALQGLLAALPDPVRATAKAGPYSVIVTGVGGTGVVTISAVLGQAAYIAGEGFGSIDMTGLAQKGGAVACHMRFAANTDDIHAIRVGVGTADLIIGGDLVVTASAKLLETMRPDHTRVVVNTHEMTTGAFTRDPSLVVPGKRLLAAIGDRAGRATVDAFNAHEIAVKLFGDSIASNMILLGYAYQRGLLPMVASAIEEAIGLNGAAVAMNTQAFRVGRLAAHDPAALADVVSPKSAEIRTLPTAVDPVAVRVDHLRQYQHEGHAERYRVKVEWARVLEAERAPGRSGFADAVAKAYHKLLSYKDEYEVARLYSDAAFKAGLDAELEGATKLEFHLAPPLLGRFYKDKLTGHPRKIKLGPWMLPVFRLLAKGRVLRGTMWDVFGMTAERRLERQMIADYEVLLDEIGRRMTPATHSTAVALAGLAHEVKGYGHVKLANYAAAKKTEAGLLEQLRNPTPVKVAAE